MSRFNQIEIAVIDRLRALKAKPDKTLNIADIADPVNAMGYSQDEIADVLSAIEQDGIVAFVPGNRLKILKRLPG